MTQVKIFEDNLLINNIEYDINEFLRTNNIRVIDIKFNTIANEFVVVMVIYEEPDNHYSGGTEMC